MSNLCQTESVWTILQSRGKENTSTDLLKGWIVSTCQLLLWSGTQCFDISDELGYDTQVA